MAQGRWIQNRWIRWFWGWLGAGAVLVHSMPAQAAEAAHEIQHLDGAALSLWWGVPFAGILLSIAILPVAAGAFWHKHFGKVSAFWALCTIVSMLLHVGAGGTLYELVHVAFLEYFPFVILLLSLFTVAGGICLRGTLVGRSGTNTGLLAFGTLIASWTGTTGAAMLLVRPVLSANAGRKYRVHTMVFFIFLVANIGGALTPLGDPPLFLGFLKGVSFFWTTRAMLAPMIILAVILLALYYVLDRFWYMPKENLVVPQTITPLSIEGLRNFILLGVVIAAVLISGSWRPGVAITIYHIPIPLEMITRDVILLLVTIVSWRITPRAYREHNHFHWFPIIEVAKLFAGIFITIVPVIAILRAGTDGELAWIIALVTNSDGTANNMAYFWLTGILSSMLDNAPTYLVFFNIAGGDAVQLMGPLATTLLAISAGSVFMGALTYIGNAPNFLVRSIVEDQGIAMPSFFGFMLWSVLILAPLFVLISLIFFV